MRKATTASPFAVTFIMYILIDQIGDRVHAYIYKTSFHPPKPMALRPKWPERDICLGNTVIITVYTCCDP